MRGRGWMGTPLMADGVHTCGFLGMPPALPADVCLVSKPAPEGRWTHFGKAASARIAGSAKISRDSPGSACGRQAFGGDSATLGWGEARLNGSAVADRTQKYRMRPSCPAGLKCHVWARIVASRVGLGLYYGWSLLMYTCQGFQNTLHDLHQICVGRAAWAQSVSNMATPCDSPAPCWML